MPSLFSRAAGHCAALLDRLGLGMRGKLVLLFVFIKILPLLLLALLAWSQAERLGEALGQRFEHLGENARRAVAEGGGQAIDDAVRALDERARDDIERLTTDTARAIARFLTERDADIRLAAALPPDPKLYQRFVAERSAPLPKPGEWVLSADGSHWENPAPPSPVAEVELSLKDNTRQFHYRPPEHTGDSSSRPLYLEMSYVDLDGRERIKVTTSPRVDARLQDVSRRENTHIRAETYFSDLKRLNPGEIYVSEVIGAYVPSRVIGPYTPQAAEKAGIPYDPAASAYAGKENPLGRRFQGLVRWATPVSRDGHVVGYVTLALDHDHLMAFTDQVLPTPERYTPIPDASGGNYAFIWDYQGRSIAHPRHYFIPGYDPATGEPQPPWLEQDVHAAWRASGKSWAEFAAGAATFQDQGLHRQPAAELRQAGLLGLDCRFLNFAPQCSGWFDLTRHGGSGSFVILWSGLWKLTTAAAIPYYTGRYGNSPRGFGFVTVGANVDEFHRPANATRKRLDQQIEAIGRDIARRSEEARSTIRDNLHRTATSLTVTTLVMVVLVVMVAIWMASHLTGRITRLIGGVARFQNGERSFRFRTPVRDEMDALARAFDAMADRIDGNLGELEAEIARREQSEKDLRAVRDHLEELVQQRTAALQESNAALQVQVQERLQAEARLRHLAEHDPLTGLANRLRFQQRLVQALAEARQQGRRVALLVFDLDRFKEVNDTLGHGFGDQLLREVAALLRSVGGSEDTVARLGGDEFAIILGGLEQGGQAAVVAERIIELLSQPLYVGNRAVHSGTSVGITVFPEDSEEPEQLMLHADLAMYQAKARGGQCYQFFLPAMHQAVLEQHQTELELREALDGGQFLLHFQPRYHYGEARVAGVEALLRWQHPHRGLLTPYAFLATAERCGILDRIDQWVLAEACSQAAAWRRAGLEFERVAVNVCARELAAESFASQVLNMLARMQLPGDLLEIEITERALIHHNEVVVRNLTELRSHGVHVAIDDLGIEHSSLQRLIECPVNVIKIDRFFVSHIGEAKSEAVIEAILAMARATQMDIVAEGVETEAQLDFLRALGCHVIQGYLHARPLPPEALLNHLRAHAQVPVNPAAS